MGETSSDALKREIREELNEEIEELRLLGVLENIFEHEEKLGHEIVFVYDGTFTNQAIYEKSEVPMLEGAKTGVALWKNLDHFDDMLRLVPEGLAELLSGALNT